MGIYLSSSGGLGQSQKKHAQQLGITDDAYIARFNLLPYPKKTKDVKITETSSSSPTPKTAIMPDPMKSNKGPKSVVSPKKKSDFVRRKKTPSSQSNENKTPQS